LSEVEALCDRAIIVLNGEIRADSRLAELASSANAILVLQDQVSGIEKLLGKMDGVAGLESMRSLDGYPAYRVLGAQQADLCPAIYDLARANEWPVRELRRDVKTLESVFNNLVTSA
jgi:ABC-2 type transport system ATP-binding protein